MSQLPKTQEQYSSHIPALHTLAVAGLHGGEISGGMSKAYHVHGLLWLAGIKYGLQKGRCFAKLRITTPAAPLLQAYQGGFFFSFRKSLNLNAGSAVRNLDWICRRWAENSVRISYAVWRIVKHPAPPWEVTHE